MIWLAAYAYWEWIILRPSTRSTKKCAFIYTSRPLSPITGQGFTCTLKQYSSDLMTEKIYWNVIQWKYVVKKKRKHITSTIWNGGGGRNPLQKYSLLHIAQLPPCKINGFCVSFTAADKSPILIRFAWVCVICATLYFTLWQFQYIYANCVHIGIHLIKEKWQICS